MISNSFPEKKLAESFYRHELTLLRKLAGLDDEMDKRRCGQPTMEYREGLERANPVSDWQVRDGSHGLARCH